MANLIGKTLAKRYRVEESLGRGGMAEVFKVWDSQRATYLAMKVLREDLIEDKVFIRRFKREAQTLARLQHPNVVRFYGLDEDKENDIVFMLMDYVEGTTLRKEIYKSKQPFSTERVLEIMRPVCSALHYAHNQGIVHCDVKPGNIMIDMQGRILLSDFGIARMSESATATMVGAGTPAYMAPEQIRGENPTPQTDIYALGVVLFEMLTGGERPFTGEKANTTGSTSEKLRWEQMNLAAPSPRKYNPNISTEIEAVVKKCLEKNPDKRYVGILQFLKAISDANVESSPEDSKMPNTITRESTDKKNENKHDLVRARRTTYEKRDKSSAKNSFENNSIRWTEIAVAVIAIAALIWFGINGQQSKLAKARVEQTAIAYQIASTTVAQQAATETAQAVAEIAIAQEMTVTAQARKNYVSTIEADSRLIFGPQNGSLKHKNDGKIKGAPASVNLTDFVAEAIFTNPYSKLTGAWDYGFLFRSEGYNKQFRLDVLSTGRWILYNNTGDPNGSAIENGNISNLNTEDRESNKIKIICQGSSGMLYVNDNFVAKLDLSARMNSGNVFVVEGIMHGDEIDGYSTDYKDFSVWNIGSASIENSATMTSTPVSSPISSDQYRAIIVNSGGGLSGRAPLDVNLTVYLYSSNGVVCPLDNGVNGCNYTWAVFDSGKGDQIAQSHNSVSFGYTFSRQGSYSILVTVCMAKNCGQIWAYIQVT